MPHYLKSQTVNHLGFKNLTSTTIIGTAKISDGESIDCTQLSGHVIKLITSATATTNFNLINYTPGAILNFTVKERGADININAPPGAKINDGSSINLDAYSSNSTSLFIFDSTNAYSTGV